MSLIFSNISDKTFGWIILGSLVVLLFLALPIVLAIDSRIVFGIAALVFSAWLLVIALRLLRMGNTFIGWGIIVSFGLFLLLSVFTTQGVPLIYITMIFTGWAGYRLVRRAPDTAKSVAAS